MLTVYGIPNCDVTKKTLKWLDAHKVKYSFHDYKIAGIDTAKLSDWVTQAGLEKVMNKKSTTWRGLDISTQTKVTTSRAAIEIMQQNNSLIKRPIIEKANSIVAIGFNENELLKLV